MSRVTCLSVLALVLVCHAARAQTDKYHITPAEQAACQPDAERLCSAAYPDEDKMIACMRANRRALSATCKPIFIAGLKRRGLR